MTTELRLDIRITWPDSHPRVREALMARIEDFVREQVSLTATSVEIKERFSATLGEVAAANETYGSDDINANDDALASRGEDGTWVQGWLFVGNTEGGEGN